MKIAFLHWPRKVVVSDKPEGSIRLWTWNVSRRLQSQHTVYVYSHRYRGTPKYERHDNTHYVRISAPLDPWIDLALRPLSIARGRRRPRMSSSWYSVQYYAQAARDMRRRGIEVVHIHSFPQAAAIVRHFHPSAKIIVHLHVEWLNLLPVRVAERQIRDADLVLGCSADLSARMQRALPDSATKIKTVYNAVDVDVFRDRHRPPTSEGDSRRVLFVGRISPEKGIHTLLAAFEQLLEDDENVFLDVVGPNWPTPLEIIIDVTDSDSISDLRTYYPTHVQQVTARLKQRYPRRLSWVQDSTYWGRLQRMVRGKMATRVRFAGYIPNEDLPRWYSEADLVVLPSLYETFGIPLIEAMASGTPVIATRVGGMPELIDHGRTGLVIDPGDEDQLAEAMRRLIRDSALRRHMGQEARRQAVDRFSWDSVVDALSQHYSDLLQ